MPHPTVNKSAQAMENARELEGVNSKHLERLQNPT
jgi:hypothetical protein